MTTPPSFPVLPGQGWSVHRRPTFSTRVAGHVSGREVRVPLYEAPLWEWEISFDGLASNAAYPGLGANSLQSLLGLYLQSQGQFGLFLYTEPTDTMVMAQAIGIGDGSNKVFSFVRTLGGFTERVGWVLGTPIVYDNGTPVGGTSWTLTAPNGSLNALTFATAPAAGHVISASFSFAFQCRFLDDQNDFENFMNGLWQVQGLKFRSVKP